MAMKEHWIAKATSKNKGKFATKAKKAGKTTMQYAEQKEGASGKLGQEARLAERLMQMKK